MTYHMLDIYIVIIYKKNTDLSILFLYFQVELTSAVPSIISVNAKQFLWNQEMTTTWGAYILMKRNRSQ